MQDSFHTLDLLEKRYHPPDEDWGLITNSALPSLKIGVISEKLQPLSVFGDILFHSTTFKLVVTLSKYRHILC